MQIVLISESAQFLGDRSLRESKVAFGNHALIINLALADLLMGIYLLSLCTVDLHYSGVYCLKSLEWLYSSTCTILGVVVVLSSEVSVLTQVLLSSIRLITVLNVSTLC